MIAALWPMLRMDGSLQQVVTPVKKWPLLRDLASGW
jgi:hypothetical protein